MVFLNIYNLGKSNAALCLRENQNKGTRRDGEPEVQSLNGIFKNVGLGAFHCAVQVSGKSCSNKDPEIKSCALQVFGTEWSYGGWPEAGCYLLSASESGWSRVPQGQPV